MKQRDKLTAALTGFLGHTIEKATFHSFVDKMHSALPKNILRSTVHNSLKMLLKRELTAKLLFEVCWRLAGNIDQLLDHKPVPEWFRQSVAEWVPVCISGVVTQRKHSLLKNVFEFTSLGGTIVPRKLVQTWSPRKTNYLATFRNDKGYGFGFGKSHITKRGEQLGRLLITDVHQYYGLQCFLLLDPDRSAVDPVATEVGHNSASMHYNKILLRHRDRSVSPCRKGLPDTHECFRCPYGTDQCSVATHKQTYTIAVCTRCTVKAFFDPTDIVHKDLCVNCAAEERKKK